MNQGQPPLARISRRNAGERLSTNTTLSISEGAEEGGGAWVGWFRINSWRISEHREVSGRT